MEQIVFVKFSSAETNEILKFGDGEENVFVKFRFSSSDSVKIELA